ncbi:MAG TPA: aminotransferase class I/II-fold pyridoxal phosphate-dependent enzyme, partial [Terriglobia bacterium]|nr:aminotransferase class I/II-fold pyridoxal phosphate-dependent enzyme [Terriglobia bacterium]
MKSSAVSLKSKQFTESVIREMTRLAMEHGAVNLAQGFPDFPAPADVKEAAVRAIRTDVNQYAITWGAREFRRAIAERFERDSGVAIDPEREITVCCGSTEAMIASLLAVVNPGEEVVIFEPFYENYGPDAIICGAVPRFVRLHPPDWTFDPQELAAAFTERTRACILNTPNNPTGKVFTREELETIAGHVRRSNAYVLTDEIYQYLVYDGARHVSMASLPEMRERTITINGMSKTFSVTGWRVGYAIAPAEISNAIRKMHDFLTVGAAAPLQEAGVTALRLPETYYQNLCSEYLRRR